MHCFIRWFYLNLVCCIFSGALPASEIELLNFAQSAGHLSFSLPLVKAGHQNAVFCTPDFDEGLKPFPVVRLPRFLRFPALLGLLKSRISFVSFSYSLTSSASLVARDYGEGITILRCNAVAGGAAGPFQLFILRNWCFCRWLNVTEMCAAVGDFSASYCLCNT